MFACTVSFSRTVSCETIPISRRSERRVKRVIGTVHHDFARVGS